MPAINGATFLNRINKMKTEVWINGDKIKDNISEHYAFKGILKSKAKLFDLQYHKDFMTYTSPLTGDKVGSSFLQPISKEDLEKRRLTTQEWAKTSGGMMGRSPDYMNTGIMALGTASDIFQDKYNRGGNIKKLYEYARENDLTFSHTFVSPQVNRSLEYFEDNQNPISARVVKKNNDGIFIKGARLLATQGGITDELLVLPVGGNFITIVVFDYVFVPWERVFLYDNIGIASRMYSESNFYPFLLHQTVARQVVKAEFLLGVAQLIVDTIDIGGYQHVQEKICELITGLETLKALLFTSEMEAKKDKWGRMIPNSNSLYAAITTFPKLYPRFTEILELLGASGLISIPTEDDFNSDIEVDLNQYLQAANCNAKERTKLFRLAWDISLSAFGGRQKLYERFFFGDPIRLKTGLYNSYCKESAIDLARSFLNS